MLVVVQLLDDDGGELKFYHITVFVSNEIQMWARVQIPVGCETSAETF